MAPVNGRARKVRAVGGRHREQEARRGIHQCDHCHITHDTRLNPASPRHAGRIARKAQEEGRTKGCRSDPRCPLIEIARRRTFKGWPHQGDAVPRGSVAQMAAVGWCFTPSETLPDRTTCYYCDLSMHEWEAEDDPWMEHRKESPSCAFFTLERRYIWQKCLEKLPKELCDEIMYLSLIVEGPVSTNWIKPFPEMEFFYCIHTMVENMLCRFWDMGFGLVAMKLFGRANVMIVESRRDRPGCWVPEPVPILIDDPIWHPYAETLLLVITPDRGAKAEPTGIDHLPVLKGLPEDY